VPAFLKQALSAIGFLCLFIELTFFFR
jgi:hypothetical protein